MTSSPTSFLAVVFASSDGAHDAMADIGRWGSDQDVDLRDSAVVSRTPGGDIDLDQSREVSAGDGLVSVGTAGLVAGLLLGLPIGGALLGLAGGAALGLRDTGIPDSRMRKLGEELQPGQALLCVLVDEDALGQLREALGRYGDVLEVELPSDSAP
ncbi:MAG: DUF1269 domain-containing protein [Solirubrobacteraceae bacterium]